MTSVGPTIHREQQHNGKPLMQRGIGLVAPCFCLLLASLLALGVYVYGMELLEALIPGLCCVVIPIVLARVIKSDDAIGAVAVLAGIAFIIWAIVAPIVYFVSLSTAAELENFNTTLLVQHNHSIDAANRILLDEPIDEESQVRLEWYNKILLRTRRFESVPIIGAYVANVPQHLQPIIPR